MKKTIQTIVLAALCLFLSSVARAQTAALKIGDTVPDITINNIINYKTTSAKLSDFKGKLLILDFWATWCSPCVAMIPKMDSLQKAFEGKVQFISVSYQDVKTVKVFMDKLQKQKKALYSLPEVVSDTVLHALFPHTTLPHYVWIGPEGKVKAITGFEEVSESRIKAALEQGSFNTIAAKTDVMLPYDKAKPLFINGNGGEWPGVPYHTLFTPFKNGLPPGFTVQKAGSNKGFRAALRNTTLLWFYSMAYGEGKQYYGPKRILLNVKDLSRFRFPDSLPKTRLNQLRWQEENTYCYEIILPPRIASEAYKFMQQDFERLIPQYSASVEKQNKTCLVLSVLPGGLKLKTSGGASSSNFNVFGCRMQNVSLDLFFSRLNTIYLQKHPYPIINESGSNSPVDLLVNAPLHDVDALNRELEKYGLKFISAERSIDMLVLSDR